MHRRSALKILAASCALPIVGDRLEPQEAPSTRPSKAETRAGRMPAIFLAHGSPYLLDDAKWTAELAAWAQAMPRPKSVLMVSAHWEQKPVTIGATRTVPLVYDFYGFPERYYQQTYAAPGAPELARRVKVLLSAAGHASTEAPERGLDHGAYVPLVAMYPEADVPVLQTQDGKELCRHRLTPEAIRQLG